MKNRLLFLTFGLLLGAGLSWAWQLSSRDAGTLAAAQGEADRARIALLEADLQGARAEAERARLAMASAGADLAPPAPNVVDLERLLNDARPLLKSLALMFGEQRRTMSEQWIRSMVTKMADDMGLTEEQAAAMAEHFIKLDGENFAKMQAMLDRKLSIFDVFTVMNDLNPQKSMDAYVMKSLTEEQRSAWEGRKLETKAQQLERTATRQLDRMTRDLQLDETQQDRVFEILVKTNPAYDPSLAVAGLATESAGPSTPGNQNEAIAEVLRPEQMEGWNTMQERQSRENKRWTDALGGFDAATFFRGMVGGGRGR